MCKHCSYNLYRPNDVKGIRFMKVKFSCIEHAFIVDTYLGLFNVVEALGSREAFDRWKQTHEEDYMYYMEDLYDDITAHLFNEYDKDKDLYVKREDISDVYVSVKLIGKIFDITTDSAQMFIEEINKLIYRNLTGF